MKENLTELVFVIDRSGSMGGLESDTIGGVNATLAKNRAVDGEAYVTTVLFDHEIKYLHDHVNLRKVADLTEKDYSVRGSTALLDAVADAINHTDRVQHYLPKPFRAKNVVVVIITDGYENASRKYRYPEVKRMIEEHREKGWEFLFLGANIDVAAEAGKLGIEIDNAAPYLADSVGQGIAYEAIAHATVSMRNCGSVAPSWADAVRADAAKRG